HVHRTVDGVDGVEAAACQVERHVDLVEEAFEARVAVAGGTGHHRHVQFAVGEVWIVAAQIEVQTAGAGHRTGGTVGRGGVGGEHTDALGARQEDVVGADDGVQIRHPL